jgi:hypothetical protein
MPEELSRAMVTHDFPMFRQKMDYLDLVYSQLQILETKAENDDVELERIHNAKQLLEFLAAWTGNNHAIAGLEEIKQLFIKESAATRESISKSGIIKDIGSE